MKREEQILNNWEKAKIDYDIWFGTLALKYKTGETIYTQAKQLFEGTVASLKEMSEIFSGKLAAYEARISELENQLSESLNLYNCQNTAILKRDERIKELENGLRNMRHCYFKDAEAVDNHIDNLLKSEA